MGRVAPAFCAHHAMLCCVALMRWAFVACLSQFVQRVSCWRNRIRVFHSKLLSLKACAHKFTHVSPTTGGLLGSMLAGLYPKYGGSDSEITEKL